MKQDTLKEFGTKLSFNIFVGLGSG